jgi:DNA primase
MSDTVQQVKDRLSIVEVVGGYVKLERAGQNMRARCPFHNERSPSFMVSPERGSYHCFGCGVGGDIFTFVQAIEGLDFKGALKVLADRAGVPIEFGTWRSDKGEDEARDRLFALMEASALWYTTQLTPEARAYLGTRGMTEDTITAFRIGWAGSGWDDLTRHLREKKFSDKEMIDAGMAKKNERGGVTDKFRNRIMFPLADSAGRVIAFSGRIFGADASPEAPKYLNSPETALFHKSRVLYGFDKAKIPMRKLNCAVLVEGQVDLVMSHQAGWGNTVAVSGTAFTEEHAALIKRMTENLVIALDADEAGIKAAGRAARAALQMGLQVKVAQLPAGADPADIILKEGAERWKVAIRDAKDIVTFLLDVLYEKLPQQDRFRRAVETIVLPFVQDVQSPIAREQYVREIAERLGVSGDAVLGSLQKVPQAPQSVPATAEHATRKESSRIGQLIGILLWQESLATPHIDTSALRAELEDMRESNALLASISPGDRERFVFEAERVFGSERSPAEDVQVMLATVRRDSLSSELAATTDALRRAEAAGEQAEAERLLEHSRVLTTRIAKLHETR